MLFSIAFCRVSIAALLLGAQVAAQRVSGNDGVDFGRDVQPVLAAKCFACHGPDASQRKAELRLDVRDVAVAKRAIVPGNAEASSLVRRIHARSDRERMPPPSSRLELSQSERRLLARWIDEGAKYGEHWAYVAPAEVAVPKLRAEDRGFARSEIDAFVLARMREVGLRRAGLEPNAEADRATLARRLSLDLVGLPPSPERVRAYLDDPHPRAYERYVDELLASPHYGERMALPWLAAARYADSNGYQHDGDRYAWPWRDWLIRSLNANVPYDRLATEMLAGDLLPSPTRDERVATAFLRHHPTNHEGGAIPAEVRFNYVVDRVQTTSTVFLGLTMHCAQCHDHKYDPISQRDYYGFFAFFNNDEDNGHAWTGRSNSYHRYQIAKPHLELSDETGRRELQAARKALGAARKAYDAAGKAIHRAEQAWLNALSEATTAKLPERIASAAKKRVGTPLTVAERRFVRRYYIRKVANNAQWRQLFDAFEARELELAKIHERQALVMVMRERKKRRPTRMHTRGQYDAPTGAEIATAIPPAIATRPRRPAATRLDLARWLVAPNNPLFARVQVNRAWQLFFGRGLVATPENFGLTGARPSHPKLLDWLAHDFATNGFDLKRLHKQIVMSAAYRRSSKRDAKAKTLDPDNRWLARAPRFRLDSHLLRDQALASAGLLDPKLFGPPVYPHHPDGWWRDVSFEIFAYPHGRRGHHARRSLYGFWRRTVAPPNLFDVASRSACDVAMSRTNSPLHALVLLNETSFVEAARGLARRVLRERRSDRERLERLVWLVLCRSPESPELEVLSKALTRERSRYRSDRRAARALLETGVLARGKRGRVGVDEVAAWTVIAQLVLNLDEALCRP